MMEDFYKWLRIQKHMIIHGIYKTYVKMRNEMLIDFGLFLDGAHTFIRYMHYHQTIT